MSATETTEQATTEEPAKVVTALVPRDQARLIDTSTIVQYLASRVSDMRHTESTEETLTAEFMKLQLSPSTQHAHLTPQEEEDLKLSEIFEQVNQLVRADQRYDSESLQARRALATVLNRTYGEKMFVTGWIPGEMVKVKPWITERSPERYFELTGRQCPECEVNPERYGDGFSGVACINEAECGWWYCA